MKLLKSLLFYALLLISMGITKVTNAQTGTTCATALNLTITPGQSTGWQTTSIDTLWYDFIASNLNCNFRIHSSLKNKKYVKTIKYGVCGNFADSHMLFKENDTTFYLSFVNLTTSNHYKLALIFELTGNCSNCNNIGEYKIDFLSSTGLLTTSCGASCPTAPDCNYLCNGSFEQTSGTPNSSGQINLACDWTSANNASPDLFTVSSSIMPVPTNGFGCENVRITGQNSYAGFVTENTLSSVWNEGLVAPLQSNLQSGKTYKISFYLSLAEASTVNADNIGFAFASSYNPFPSVVNFGTHDPTVPINTANVTKNGWVGFSYNYVATGNETHFLIGAINGVCGVGTTPIDAGTCVPSGGENSYYYIDDISILQTISATASSTSICSGSSTTLTASGSSDTYTWSTGATTTSISVSPTVSTIYTVTGTNSLGCASQGTVLVTVNSSYCCQTPVITFTTGTISSQTTAVSYGAVLIAVNGTLTINTPNFTFTKTNIRMAPNAKIIIAPSCSVSLSGAHLFSCDYMWEGIEMQNNSQLITSKSLVTSPTLDDANIGIYANANSMTNPPSIGLNYLIMSKNHIGIKIENYTGAAPYPFGMGAVTIQGNVATSFSPSTILKPYLSTSGTIYFPTTQYGVNLVNVSEAIVGSFTGYRNNFKKMQYGIRMVKSNAKIIRNDFLDFGTAYDNKAIWVAGDVALSPPLGSIPLGYGTKHRFSVGVGTSNYCTFQNVKYGIFSDSCMTAYIETNTFKDINGTGISINRSNFYRGFEFYDDMPYLGFYDRDTVSINTNTMIPLSANANVMQNGITMNDNYYLSSLVYNNSINLKPATNIWSTGVSISHASTNYNSSYLTFNNLINGTGNVGIQELNDAALFATSGNTRGIASNTITLGTGYCGGWLPIPNMGIYSINSPYAVIAENIIDESSLGGAPACLQGIVISNGQQDYIGCNLVKNTNIGFSINNNNLNSVFRGNVMNTATTGLKLSSGTMGNIGATNDAAQNEWYNISTNHTFVSNSFVLANIYYDGGVGRIPSINGNTAGSIPFTPVITNTTTLGCTQHYKGGNNSKINPKDDNDALVAAIIQDNVQFSDYNHGLLWEHKNGILNLLKDSLLDNTKPLFAQFRQQNTNSKLGKINNLMHSLGNYSDVLQNKNTYLQALNSIGAATNVVEQNYKTFIAEYLTNVVGVSSVSGSTYDMMKDLALKCPYTDGASVYHARALMKVLGDNEPYYNSCEATQESNAAKSATANTPQDALQNVLVYPNPNSGTFSIAYAFENNTNTFTLVDVLGKVVLSKTLTGTVGIETITTQDVLSGIYFYHVTDNNGKQTHTGKLMINK